MNLFEAIRVFHSPRKWVTKDLSPEEALQVETNLKSFKSAKRIVESHEIYRELSTIEGQEIALLALELYDSQPDVEEIDYLPHIILTNLANGVSGSLSGLYSRLLERDLSWKSNALFREADPVTREQMITFLESGKQRLYSREDLLCAVAWIGDERVQQQFLIWKQTPPTWSKSLYLPPEDYTYEAGWELTVEGGKRNLYYQANYDLDVKLINNDMMVEMHQPIAITPSIDEQCGWCGRQLLSLFDIDLSDPRMAFLGIQGEHLRIALCLNCSSQNYHIFTEVDGHGGVRWSRANGECPGGLSIYDEKYFSESSFAQLHMLLGQARRTPYVSEGSHIGGCPDWVQDADFPRCPICLRTMIFIAQYEPYQVPYLEGIFYAFVCTACSLAATGYQQT